MATLGGGPCVIIIINELNGINEQSLGILNAGRDILANNGTIESDALDRAQQRIQDAAAALEEAKNIILGV